VQLTREPEALSFSFNRIEASLLRRVLEELKRHYSIPPADLDPKIAAAWYSTRGCEGLGLSAEDTRLWQEHLHELKGPHAKRIGGWLQQLGTLPAQAGTVLLRLDLTEGDPFITILNDHRLHLAARHDIGQPEMEVRTQEAMAELPARQQEALIEIHILAWLIEVTLEAMTTPFEPEEEDPVPPLG
jgi:hypothetical protein